MITITITNSLMSAVSEIRNNKLRCVDDGDATI